MTRNRGTRSCLSGLGRRMAADERGITAVVTALGIVVLMGFAGLGVDVTKWLSSTRAIQAAADQAAYSAASAAGTTFCPNDASTTQAKAVAAARGFVNGQDDTTVTVTCPSTESFKVAITQGQPLEVPLAAPVHDLAAVANSDIGRSLDLVTQVPRHTVVQRSRPDDERDAGGVAGQVHGRLARGVPASNDVHGLAPQRSGFGR